VKNLGSKGIQTRGNEVAGEGKGQG
jgi:hypothetical protein